MNINSFESFVRTKKIARRYLASLCWKNYRRFCIRCNSYQIYQIAGRRLRCKRCKYTFHDFTGRWANKLRISCQDWLWIIKFSELELSARKIAQQIDLSYPPVLKAVTLIRKAIVANSADANDLLSGEIELDEAYFGGRRKGNDDSGVYHKVKETRLLQLKQSFDHRLSKFI